VKTELCDALWPDEERLFELAELIDLTGLSEAEVVELVEFGALAPASAAQGHWVFGVHAVSVARTAHRLADDFALEPHAVALLLAYLDRIRELERELDALRAGVAR